MSTANGSAAAMTPRLDVDNSHNSSEGTKSLMEDFYQCNGPDKVRNWLWEAGLWDRPWRLRVLSWDSTPKGTLPRRCREAGTNGLKIIITPSPRLCLQALLQPLGGWGNLQPHAAMDKLNAARERDMPAVAARQFTETKPKDTPPTMTPEPVPPQPPTVPVETPPPATKSNVAVDLADMLLGAEDRLKKITGTVARLKEIVAQKRALQQQLESLDSEMKSLMSANGTADFYLNLLVILGTDK